MKYLQEIQPKTIEDVLKSKTGGLTRIIKNHGLNAAKAMLIVLINDLLDFFNYNRTMTINQIGQTIELIIDNYGAYTPEDFKICFNAIKIGKYGKFYEGIDGGKILEMIKQYDIERDQDLINYRQKENKNFNTGNIHHSVASILKPIFDKKNEKVNMNLIITEPRPRTEHEILIQEIMQEFDLLHKNKPYNEKETFKTIPYNGKNLMIDQFVNLRLEELNKL